MPRRTPNKKPSISPELKELRAIRAELKTIRQEIDKTVHVRFGKRAAISFGTGVAKGFGLLIGTTVVAAAVIFILQQFVDWTGVGESIGAWILQQFGPGLPR